MNIERLTSVRGAPTRSGALMRPANLLLAVGCAVVALPTMVQVARDSWSTEQGGHGPLVLATGVWAVWRELKTKRLDTAGGSMPLSMALLTVTLGIFVVSRITDIIQVEAFAMYAALVSVAYMLFGAVLIRSIWFPLAYLAFALPPPDSWIMMLTQPIKIAISYWVVFFLSLFGYPVASSGVTIQIGQYELLVAAACAGLNSIVTLTALCLFYVYLRHRSSLSAFIVIAVAAIPIAVLANLARVMALVLITYHFGDAAAQGFLHDFAGLLMFSVALLAVFGIDQLAAPLFGERKKVET